MSADIRGRVGHALRRAGAAAVAVLLAGCGVTPASTHWQRLQRTPAAQVLANDDSVIRTIRPFDLPANGESTVKIGHSDPVISNEGATSYVKLFRFLGKSAGTYEILIDAWCDCPATAILWGTSEFPIFYPKLAVLDRDGKRLIVMGNVMHLSRTLTSTARIRGQWQVTLTDTSPYYVLVTSQHTGPDYVGELGGDIGQQQSSSPVGKIRLKVEHVN
jgi:hypothetical protein